MFTDQLNLPIDRERDSQYVEIEVSSCLPKLSSAFLIEFINRGLRESPLTIENDFIQQLQ